MPETPAPTPLALALGRIPTGLYVVSTLAGDGVRPLGFVGSFVMQHGFEPPTLSVAVGKGRDHLSAMRDSGRFALSILDAAGSGAMGAFFKKYQGTETAFDHVEYTRTPGGLAVLTSALAWLECRVTGEHEAGDHVVVFGTATAGSLSREGDPSVHLRKDGLRY